MFTKQQLDQVKQLANATPVAKATMRYIANRERSSASMDLRRLRQDAADKYKTEMNTQDFNSLFFGLEKLGFGKFYPKRHHGDADRFKWNSLICVELARKALGEPKAQKQAVSVEDLQEIIASQALIIEKLSRKLIA